VLPADENIALIAAMSVLDEVATPVLELDAHALPHVALSANGPFCLTVGKSSSDALNYVAEIERNHAKKVDDALLIDRCVLESTKVEKWSVAGASGGCR